MHKTLDFSASILPIGFPPPEYGVEGIWWEDRHMVIYRALRKQDMLRVLLKTPRASSQAPETRVDSLEREYQITQSLVTDCAAKPFALKKTASGTVLVYADEGFRPLEELAAKAPLNLESVLTLGISMAEAVNGLHKEQVIHCNLNPTTVWLHDSGKILLSDFNCARVPGQDAHSQFPLARDLTDLRYIAPEQTGRLRRHLDQRTDLYSVGIILFRLLTGRVPFSGRDPLHVIDGHLTKKPAFPADMKTGPNIFCNVILKALSKNPEDRYLTASGLVADMRECLAQWRTNGVIEEFELGRQDAKGCLRISRRLYGRDRPTAWLWEKAGTVGRDKPTFLLVRGAPGVGKSALLRKLEGLHRPEGCRLIAGKFDQFKRNVPYLPLVQAFQQLIAQLLGEGEEQFTAWRSRILDSIGNNAEVVSEVIPELRLITGVQPPVQFLPPIQARNRFNSVFTSLIRAFAPYDRPLCLVLEDLHWADAASLGLLAHVFTAAETQNLLIVGAYRDSEVGPTHPLQQMIVSLEQAGVNIHILALEELGLSDISQLVQDTLDVSDAEAYELAEVLHAKTAGNPLYVTQLLHFLCDRGLIEFDYGSARWVWNLARVQQEGVTEDVLNLLDMRFENLDQSARSVLATAACLGSGFEVGKLAVAAEMPVTEVLAFVTAAVDQGFLLRLEDPAAGPGPPTLNSFRFLHDRIQQAAFDSVSEDAKKGFRLKIGLRLMAALAPKDEGAPQPDVLSNLNYAWELITDPEIMRCAAQFNLVMGRKARHSLAYHDALSYIRVGLSLLEATAWESNHELAFELNSEALECEYLTGNFDQAEQRFGILIANSQSRLDAARTYLTKILLDTSGERYEQAIKLGTEALSLFGITYLRKPSRLHLLRELVEARLRMKGRRPEKLLENIGLKDPEKLAALRILVALFPTAYFLSPDLLIFTGLKVVNFSLRYGISPLSAGGFVLYGLGLGAAMDQHERGYQFGRFAVALAERGNDPSIICKVLVIFAQFIKFWRDPIEESFPLIERARTMALEVGDHQYVDYAIIGGISLRFSRGSSLQEVLQHCEEHSAFVLRSKDAFPVEALTMWRNCVLALQGRTAAPYSLNNEGYDESAAEQRYHQTGNITLASYQYTLRLQLAYLFGRYDEALALAEKSETVIRSAPGYITVADHYLYRGLTVAAALNGAFPNRRHHWRTLRRCLTRLQHFAVNSPSNFLHCETLLKAEAARLRGQVTEALKHYDCTIELAEARGFTPLVALANERAAQCCIANNQRRVANWYRNCARSAYEEWGASAKVASLDHQYGSTTEVGRDIDTLTGDHRSLMNVGSFDIAAALQAARIISTGNKADRVLTHLMQVIRLQISAETAHLLVVEDGKVRVEASAAVERDSVLLFPPSEAAPFSPTIVNYVMHTGDDVIVSDACEDPRFANCTHVASRRTKSVICMGVRHQGQILGLIYLEHTQLSGVFDAPKVEWLRILATEVGLMLWSGRLSRYREYVRKFAPTAILEQIDANPTKPDLAAKDCDISILFADLQGYTHLSELMPPKQLHDLISRVFSKFVDEVHRYEGALLEIRGDELFVMFADEDQSRHARQAANTALAIGRAAARINFELKGNPFPLLMNIGINSGLACVGLQEVHASTGSRWRYAATGSMVNIAARVRELARDGSILITAEAASRVAEDFILEDLGENALKNVMSSVHVYRLVSEQSR